MMKQKTNLKLSNKTPMPAILSVNNDKDKHYRKYHKHNKDCNHGWWWFSSTIFRYVIGFTLIVAYLNYRFVYSYNSSTTAVKVVNDDETQVQQQRSKVSTVNRSKLSYFQVPRMPSDHLQISSDKTLLKEWQKWAKEPIVGSFQYNPMTAKTTSKSNSDKTTAAATSVIHFPSIDLEHYYNGNTKLEMKSLSTTGASTSSSWFVTASKTSLQSCYNSAVLTRQGQKYSQGESMSNEDEEQQADGLYRQPNQDRILIVDRFSDTTTTTIIIMRRRKAVIMMMILQCFYLMDMVPTDKLLVITQV